MYRIILSLVLLVPISVQAIEDPTRPSSYRSVARQQQQLKVESILFSDDRKVAVINGTVVAEGERVGAARVVSIGKNNVRLTRNGKVVNLTLGKALIRQEK